MKNRMYLADPIITAIPTQECHEPMIDLKHQTTLNYGPPPETTLTAPCYTKLRLSIYKKLCLAQQALPHGWSFRVYEGFRSLEVQHLLFEHEYKKLAELSPLKTHTDIFHETTRLVSPITNLDGTKNTPPHNTGGAVDIEILDSTGKLIDMGMAVCDWNIVNPDLCLTHNDSLSPIAQKNRGLLLAVMTKQGFINYAMEWWHFSYGDRYWAYHTHQTHAIYGPADSIEVSLDF